jgi:DNA-binding transcriptional LysR family regulator
MPITQQSADGAALAELYAFVAVAENLSFTRASRRLDRDATVLSRRLSSLEKRLGVRLVERTTRTVVLTEAGRLYLTRARAILDALKEADLEAASLATGEPRGHLRIALPSSFGRMWLAPVIAQFLAAHPRITIEAEFSDRLVDVVGERFDLAVRLGELTDSRLVARKLCSRRRLLCAALPYLERNGTPQHPEELTAHDCLIFNGLASPRKWELRHPSGDIAHVAVSGPFVSDDAEVLVEAAAAGLGILLATDWLVGKALETGRLLPILVDWRVADGGAIYLVTPSGAGKTSGTRALSEWFTTQFRRPPWSAEIFASTAD